MDDLDRKIVALLLEDGRRSLAAIGKQISLSTAATKRRVDRLRATGVITGFTAVVSREAMGWRTEAFIEIYCEGRVSPEEMREGFAERPEVVGAWSVAGDADAIVRVSARDMEHLEVALEGLRRLRIVARTRTQVVFSTLLERPPGPGGLGEPEGDGERDIVATLPP
jgi:DNA-binding Lrp family transcriptional regulator